MKVLGIIPARFGSKRVKDKNIKLLNGKPLIQYTIECAKKSNYLTEVIVSTDSKKYADLTNHLGVRAPFLRPKELSSDTTPDKPVITHILDWLKENENKSFDAVILLRPTAPFRTPELIDDVVELAKSGNMSSIRTVTSAKGVHHPYWMYKEHFGYAEPLIKGKSAEEYYQSQMLPEVFRLNGVVDLIFTKTIYEEENLYGAKMAIHEIPESISFDIDTEMDFKICECLMKEL